MESASDIKNIFNIKSNKVNLLTNIHNYIDVCIILLFNLIERMANE